MLPYLNSIYSNTRLNLTSPSVESMESFSEDYNNEIAFTESIQTHQPSPTERKFKEIERKLSSINNYENINNYSLVLVDTMVDLIQKENFSPARRKWAVQFLINIKNGSDLDSKTEIYSRINDLFPKFNPDVLKHIFSFCLYTADKTNLRLAFPFLDASIVRQEKHKSFALAHTRLNYPDSQEATDAYISVDSHSLSNQHLSNSREVIVHSIFNCIIDSYLTFEGRSILVKTLRHLKNENPIGINRVKGLNRLIDKKIEELFPKLNEDAFTVIARYLNPAEKDKAKLTCKLMYTACKLIQDDNQDLRDAMSTSLHITRPAFLNQLCIEEENGFLALNDDTIDAFLNDKQFDKKLKALYFFSVCKVLAQNANTHWGRTNRKAKPRDENGKIRELTEEELASIRNEMLIPKETSPYQDFVRDSTKLITLCAKLILPEDAYFVEGSAWKNAITYPHLQAAAQDHKGYFVGILKNKHILQTWHTSAGSLTCAAMLLLDNGCKEANINQIISTRTYDTGPHDDIQYVMNILNHHYIDNSYSKISYPSLEDLKQRCKTAKGGSIYIEAGGYHDHNNFLLPEPYNCMSGTLKQFIIDKIDRTHTYIRCPYHGVFVKLDNTIMNLWLQNNTTLQVLSIR